MKSCFGCFRPPWTTAFELAEAFSGIFASFQWFRMDLVRINAIENGRYPLQRMAVLSLAIGNLT
jgi:hypothetical protein